jgi:small subunit ribosomal protein S17
MKKQKQGKVISDKMQSTVIVETISLVSHPMYKKTLKRKSKFVAHSPDNKAKVGDTVRIVETRPLSKTKRWKVVEIIKAAKSTLETTPHKRTSKIKKSKKKGAK